MNEEQYFVVPSEALSWLKWLFDVPAIIIGYVGFVIYFHSHFQLTWLVKIMLVVFNT